MNETMSLVLATTILAIGGLGLYMYKQSDDFKDDINDDFSSGSDSYSESDLGSELDDDIYMDNYEPKIVNRGKTKRSKPSNGTKKKRY
jgi:hypothetical protein